MLLKSTFNPVVLLFAAVPTKINFPRRALVSTSAVPHHCPPTVRQNAAPAFPQHRLPPTSAYVHLPFCRKRCHYCDFPIIALGSPPLLGNNSLNPENEDDPRVSSYVETLCREIHATQLDFVDRPPLETVFFGGGTPSLVPPRLVSRILAALSSKFGICSTAEISMEMDPGTFDAAKMKGLMDLGVNRVSLGVQAFQEQLLKACGRAHGVPQVFEAIEIIKSCGVSNWSLDLISSLPNQSPRMWEESLQMSIRAQPTHISVYDLQVENGTKFGVLYSPGEFPLPSENQSAEFYRMASRMLTGSGYDHYEISSYCTSGYRCKHNSTYWKNMPYYAFGLGSASYVDGLRFSRPRRLKDYVAYVQNLELGLVNNSWSGNDTEAKDLAMDIVMLSLRTSDGLDLRLFGEAFGDSLACSICEVYRPYVDSGHVLWLDDQRRVVAADECMFARLDESLRDGKLAFLRLSDPDGFLVSNELISLAFEVLS